MKFMCCPNPKCQNVEKGYQILECKECGYRGCYNKGFWSSTGCWMNKDRNNDKNTCPNCKAESFWGHRILDEL